MPWAVAKPCTTPGCPNMQPCATHARPRKWAKDKRANAGDRGYGAGWTKRRMHVLYRDGVCAFCGGDVIEAGRPIKGATVHHIIPKPEGSDEESNLTACHKECHDRHHGRIR